MLVRDRMTTSVCTVSPDTPLERALMLIRSRHIRSLPVLQQGRLVGIVTLTDLMRAQPPPATFLRRLEIPALMQDAQVHEVMTPSPETVSPETPLEEAAVCMRRRKIGGLPVVKNGVLVGIVTESDIFDAFIELLGVRWPSYRLTLDVDDGAAALPNITAVFFTLGLPLYSVSTYSAEQGRFEVVMRVGRAIPLTSLVNALKERGLEIVHAADGGRVVIDLARVGA
ncbi:MAG TPA: CBS domain-containing protein [bacterium]|nr:CBS domain-containing protein [bacterium]